MRLDILFLDIDGVLNPLETYHKQVFAPECVAQLKRLFAAHPKLRVVFSTSWRLGRDFFELGWRWRDHDLPLQAVLSRTPEIGESRRGEEIRKWLDDCELVYPGAKVGRYAAVDDEPASLLEELPRQNVFACDCFQGLSDEVTDRLIHHFN